MVANKNEQDVIKELQGSHQYEETPSSQMMASSQVPTSLVSQYVDKETIQSIVDSQLKSQHLSQAIAELQPKSQVAVSRDKQRLDQIKQQISPDNEATSLLFKQLFDFVESMMARDVDKIIQSQVNGESINQSMNTSNAMFDQKQGNQGSVAMQDSEARQLTTLNEQKVASIDASVSHHKSVQESNKKAQPQRTQIVAESNVEPVTSSFSVTDRKVVKRTIIINMPSGQKERHVQSHVFTRYGMKDKETGAVNWEGWNHSQATLPAYVTEDLMGYQRHPKVIPSMIVVPTSHDSIVQVTYELAPVVKKKPVLHQSAPKEIETKKKPIAIDAEELRSAIDDEKSKEDVIAMKRHHAQTDASRSMSAFAVIALAFASLLGCEG